MRINSAEGLALAKRLYRKYGSWKAVRAALAGEAATAAKTPESGLVHEHATAKPERPNTGPHNV